MTAPSAQDYAIGACTQCLNVSVITPSRQSCLVCGRLLELRIPFSSADPTSSPDVLTPTGPLTPPEPAPEAESSPALPAPDGVPAEEEAHPPSTPSPREGFAALAVDYLAGWSITAEELEDALLSMSAEPEDAVSAVGRLTAVRELLERLVPPEA